MDLILMEIARLRADLARRDAITIVVIGVLLTAILNTSRMHEEFNMMASRVGISLSPWQLQSTLATRN